MRPRRTHDCAAASYSAGIRDQRPRSASEVPVFQTRHSLPQRPGIFARCSIFSTSARSRAASRMTLSLAAQRAIAGPDVRVTEGVPLRAPVPRGNVSPTARRRRRGVARARPILPRRAGVSRVVHRSAGVRVIGLFSVEYETRALRSYRARENAVCVVFARPRARPAARAPASRPPLVCARVCSHRS